MAHSHSHHCVTLTPDTQGCKAGRFPITGQCLLNRFPFLTPLRMFLHLLVLTSATHRFFLAHSDCLSMCSFGKGVSRRKGIPCPNSYRRFNIRKGIEKPKVTMLRFCWFCRGTKSINCCIEIENKYPPVSGSKKVTGHPPPSESTNTIPVSPPPCRGLLPRDTSLSWVGGKDSLLDMTNAILPV